MKTNLHKGAIWFIFHNLPIIMTAIFFFLLGISAGVFMESFLSPENRVSIQSFLDTTLFVTDLSGINLPHVFFDSLVVNLILIFVIAIAGFTVVGFPLALLILSYKGAALGFSSALFIETMGVKGISMVTMTLMPQNLLFIPAFLCGTVASLSMSFSILSEHFARAGKNLFSNTAGYIYLFMILSLLILGGCFIEAFICPFLQQLAGSPQ